MVWKWLFNTQLGLINYLLRPFITAPIRWLGLPGTTLFVIIFVTAWHSMGYYMVIFLAGLQSIPEQLYEVAEINGANGWQKFRSVTWPLMTPITFFVVLMITFSAVRSFDIIYVMTGGTESATGVNVYSYRLYIQAFMYFKMGYASSMAWLLFVALAGLTMLQWYNTRRSYWAKRGRTNWVQKLTVYSLCVLVSAITLFPFLWMVVTSLKEPSQAMVFPPEFLPNPLHLNNYPELMNTIPFFKFLWNSIKITVIVVFGRVFICSLGGYGFARFNFPGKGVAFSFLISSMLIPAMLALLPLYIGYNYIGWIDTHWPLIIPPIVANTFGTFLMRQNFYTIPQEYDQVARIDGCSSFKIFWRILLPLSKPTLATLAVFTYLSTWNNFLLPLIVLNDVDKFTLPVGLAFLQNEFTVQYTLLMAGTTLAVIPVIAIYIFSQRFFIQGVLRSGLKG
jgi:multiple sugar transport system permease protein